MEGTEAVATESGATASAEAVFESAEIQGESPEETTESPEVGEGESAAETAEGEEAADSKDKELHKPANERIRELIDRNKETAAAAEAANRKAAELEQRLNSIMEQQTTLDPDLKPIDYEAVNQYVGQTLDRIEQLKMEGRILEALDLQDGIAKLRTDIKAHEDKRAAKLAAQTEQQKAQQFYSNLDKQLDNAVNLVKAEFKISDEVMNQARDFFAAERAAKPLLNAQYCDIIMTQGAVKAILFAKEYCDREMGIKEKQEAAKRDIEKQKLAPAATAANNASIEAEVKKLHALAEANPGDTDAYMRWVKAKSKLKT